MHCVGSCGGSWASALRSMPPRQPCLSLSQCTSACSGGAGHVRFFSACIGGCPCALLQCLQRGLLSAPATLASHSTVSACPCMCGLCLPPSACALHCHMQSSGDVPPLGCGDSPAFDTWRSCALQAPATEDYVTVHAGEGITCGLLVDGVSRCCEYGGLVWPGAAQTNACLCLSAARWWLTSGPAMQGDCNT